MFFLCIWNRDIFNLCDKEAIWTKGYNCPMVFYESQTAFYHKWDNGTVRLATCFLHSCIFYRLSIILKHDKVRHILVFTRLYIISIVIFSVTSLNSYSNTLHRSPKYSLMKQASASRWVTSGTIIDSYSSECILHSLWKWT